MTLYIMWLMRFGHIVAAGIWVGAYAVLFFALLPRLAREPSAMLRELSITAVRLGTYAGTVTMGFGLVLIMYTRGWDKLLTPGWGHLVLTSLVIAVVLMGIGDGGLRPVIRRAEAPGDAAPATRWALIGLLLSVIAIGLMSAAAHLV